jgi:outer membrane protein assembly factor BamB
MHRIALRAAAWAVVAACSPSGGAVGAGPGTRVPLATRDRAATGVEAPAAPHPGTEARRPGRAGGTIGWPTHRGNPQRTGRADVRGPRRACLKWAFATAGRISADAAVTADGGTIYVASHDGRLYALGADGRARWAFDAGDKIWSAPAVGADGTVYFGSDADRLYAVEPDGRQKWQLSTAAPPVKGDRPEDGRYDVDTSPAILADGTVVVGCHADVLAARPDSGALVWSFDAGAGTAKVFSSPALGRDDTIYFGTQGDRFFAIDPHGKQLWSFDTKGDNDATPAVADDDTVIFGSDDGHVRAMAPGGAFRWLTNLGGPIRAPVAIGFDGTVYVATYGEEPFLAALDGATGVERWRFRTAPGEGAFYGIQSGALVDADGYVYFGGRDHFAYCLSPEGELVWKYETGDQVDASPAIGPDGTLYIGSDDGKLYAFGR